MNPDGHNQKTASTPPTPHPEDGSHADSGPAEQMPSQSHEPAKRRKPSRRGDGLRKFKAVLTLILIIAVAVFSVQNTDVVELRFLTWHFSAPRALIVVIFTAIGFVLALITSSFATLRRRR